MSLIESGSAGGRISLRVRLDVVGAGLVQRLRSSGLAGDAVPPDRRIRAGLLLVLSSWATFVVAGLGFAKTAEHWQAVTAQPDRGVPAAAYDAVLLAAELGTLAVLLGIVLTARPLFAFLRAGGWKKIHRAVLCAFAATGLTGVILLAVVVWAHHVTAGQRNGGDLPYSEAFLLLVASGVASLALGTYAAVATARELDLARASLRREMFLAVVTTVMMAVMTVAATIWWTSVYGASARMLAMTLVMVSATGLATTGVARAARDLGG